MALIFILITIAFTVTGQLLVKQGMLELGPSPTQAPELVNFIWKALTNFKVILGLSSAVIAALAWTVALSHSDLSFAYPFMSLAIVLVIAFSPLIFHENIPWTRWFGVLIVCIGILIASRS
jgi:drug/metabolite transporter (DMT)-like permease